MKNKTYRNFYLISLAVIVLLSAYPIYMGVKVAGIYFAYGYVAEIDYPKYIIPYAPMCMGIILSAALIPLLYRFARRATQAVSTAVGVGVFVIFELLFEKIKVLPYIFSSSSDPMYLADTITLDSWQLSLCIATPEVLEAIGKQTYTDNNPAYKVHFYIIAILIIVCTLGILCGFTKMIREDRREMKIPLAVQSVSVTLFIGLCVLACFTAFYRNGTINISPLSAVLTCLFFIVFGVTFGLYITGFLCKRRKWYSYVVPAASASIMTVVMYIGELVLMGGAVFCFGTGFFFSPISDFPLAPCDILVILASGIITLILSWAISKSVLKNGVKAE